MQTTQNVQVFIYKSFVFLSDFLRLSQEAFIYISSCSTQTEREMDSLTSEIRKHEIMQALLLQGSWGVWEALITALWGYQQSVGSGPLPHLPGCWADPLNLPHPGPPPERRFPLLSTGTNSCPRPL